MKRAAVIGGGIAGLVAAYRLMKAGHTVSLIEKTSLGGYLASRAIDGMVLEEGPHTIRFTHEMQQLVTELDLERECIFAEPKTRRLVWNEGEVKAVPFSFPKLISSDLFSWNAKVRLMKGLLSPHHITREDTVLIAGEKLFGREAASKVLGPMVRGIFGGSPDKLVFSAIFPKLWEQLALGRSPFRYLLSRGSKNRLVSFRQGLQTLADKLTEQLEKITPIQDRICRVRPSGSGTFMVKGTLLPETEFDAVIIATNARAAGEFLGESFGEFREAASAIRYASVVTVHFKAEASTVPPHTFGALFPESTGSPLMGVLYPGNVFKRQAPSGVTVCLGGVGKEALCTRSDYDLEALAREESQLLAGIALSDLLYIARAPAAIPQYDSSQQKLIKLIEQLEAQYAGFYFIGAERGGVGIPDRVAAATRATAHLIQKSEKSESYIEDFPAQEGEKICA